MKKRSEHRLQLPPAAQAGFTLVEVLVALLIMAIMATMAWQGVDGIVRARSSSQEHLERTLRLDTVLQQWEQDLAAVQDSTVLPSALACDGATVRLTRRTPTGMQVVAWSLRPDTVNSGVWVRWAGPPVTTTGALQDSWMRSLQLQGGEPGEMRALAGVTAARFYFFQPQSTTWSNCLSSGNLVTVAAGPAVTVPAAAPNTSPASSPASAASAASAPTLTSRFALPRGVRVVLSFAPGSGFNGDVVRDIQLGP